MKIDTSNMPLPIGKSLTKYLARLIENIKSASVTLTFRDPNYSATNGGFHPVEIRLEFLNDLWRICYITDYAYVGSGVLAELCRDLDFDFEMGIFTNLYDSYPIKEAKDIYQLWEQNFRVYALEMEVFGLEIST